MSNIDDIKIPLRNATESMRNLERTNYILVITNLINSGVITLEEALNDERFRNFVSNMKLDKSNTNNDNVIKANIKR